MSRLTAFVLSLFLFVVTGCGASGSRPAAPPEVKKHPSTVKPATHDEGRSMNEESQNAVMER